MATWNDLVAYVQRRYEVTRRTGGELWFDLATGEDRQQLAMVREVTGQAGHRWVQIASPIGDADHVDLRKLLELAGDYAVGGAVVVDGMVVFRHSIPLADAALAAFDRSFRVVVEAADELEEALTDGDEH